MARVQASRPIAAGSQVTIRLRLRVRASLTTCSETAKYFSTCPGVTAARAAASLKNTVPEASGGSPADGREAMPSRSARVLSYSRAFKRCAVTRARGLQALVPGGCSEGAPDVPDGPPRGVPEDGSVGAREAPEEPP